MFAGSPGRTRTCNLAVNSRPLYRLSYRGARVGEKIARLMAAEPGFEPGPKDPKSRVLPLHHSALRPLRCAQHSTIGFGAEGRSRTGTGVAPQQILSPANAVASSR
jgi:hypothetical protein